MLTNEEAIEHDRLRRAIIKAAVRLVDDLTNAEWGVNASIRTRPLIDAVDDARKAGAVLP